MKFRTEIELVRTSVKINYNSNLFLIGSCFTNNIGDLLEKYKFNIITNPFGVLYNPISVSNSLNSIINNKLYKEQDLIINNETWVSLDHHGSFSNEDKDVCLQNINNSVLESNKFLKKTDVIFLTLGTAWIFNYIKQNKTVANCHKIPAKEFTRKLISVDDIEIALSKLFDNLSSFNSNIKVVLTISPIRHIKDGLHQNQVSKATLLLAVNNLVEKFSNVSYFPSYEIILDDLRDYRFFTDDLVHLSEMAKQYVWDKFIETYVDNSQKDLMQKIESIQRAVNHRPFNIKSVKHKEFIKSQINNINKIQASNPNIDFTNEIETFNKQLL